jgi:tRNA(Ile)-lysidine synthase
MTDDVTLPLARILADVPAGPCAVGVSGGADSMALLRAVVQFATHLTPSVVHVNHQTRGADSDADAELVRSTCDRLNVPCHVRTRVELEPQLTRRPANRSALFRALRLRAFALSKQTRILLAHHADDQAETVLFRLLRNTSALSLRGIRPAARVGPLTIYHPLLTVRRAHLHAYLQSIQQPWREDASNQQPAQARNRIRAMIGNDQELVQALNTIAQRADRYASALHALAGPVQSELPIASVLDQPAVLSRLRIARWLESIGVTPDQKALELITRMCEDLASPGTLTLAQGVRVRRARGQLSRA